MQLTIANSVVGVPPPECAWLFCPEAIFVGGRRLKNFGGLTEGKNLSLT